MKKILILTITMAFAVMVSLTPKAHAYTIDNGQTYYNQTTDNKGQADYNLASSTSISLFIYDLNYTNIYSFDTIRLVFSNPITAEELPHPNINQWTNITIIFYDGPSITPVLTLSSNYKLNQSLSYYENNFRSTADYIDIRAIEIIWEDLPLGFNEDYYGQILNKAIIKSGNDQVINNTINNTSYTSGWNDAMNSKVTQIWFLWGNIFQSFMNVFDIFNVHLMGDITIGHIALVPLVLGLIGFIYALGGKRGR